MAQQSNKSEQKNSKSDFSNHLLDADMTYKGECTKTNNLSCNTMFLRVFVKFPYDKPYGHIFQCKNNESKFTIMANHKFGLPYGKEPRIFLASIINEVRETKSPILNISTMYSNLLYKLNITQCNEHNLRDQMLRFFSSYISCSYQTQSKNEISLFRSFDFWQIPLKGSKGNFSSSSTIVLTKDFYNELINYPIQIDYKILKDICHSSILMDVYVWLMWRYYYFKLQTLISWDHLINQFNPEHTEKTQCIGKLKERLIQAFQILNQMSDLMNIEVQDNGIILTKNRQTTGEQ